MKSKKIISGLLALTFVFGGAVLPNTVVGSSIVASASYESGTYSYSKLNDGTIAITNYYKFGNSESIGTDNDPVDVVFPSEIDGYKVSQIGNGSVAAIHCEQTVNIEKITIPEGVTKINESAFSHFHSLKCIELPDTITTIDRDAFYYCTNLEKVNLPKGITKISKEMFEECGNLKSISIPDGVKSIGDCAFKECIGLTSAYIPVSVTEIGNDAFVCYVEDSKHNWLRKPLENLTIYCYRGSYAESYANANGLKYQLIDGKTSLTYPTNINVNFSEQYHQLRFSWDYVENAQQYGIAVYLAGKWRIQSQNITATSYTTPKNLTPGKSYKVAIAAKVNGKWNTSDPIKNAITVTVK